MKTNLIAFFATLASAAMLPAATLITLTERTPFGSGGGGSGTRTLTTALGSVSAPAVLPTITYTLTDLDLTSVGGSADDEVEIVFTVGFSQTGGDGVQFNGFGNISVTGGGNNNFINTGQALTTTISLVSTTFSGGLSNLSAGFDFVNIGGVGTDESWNIVHDSGTVAGSNTNTPPANYPIPLSSFFTIQDVEAPTTSTINLQGYNVLITAIPEPASASLLALGAFALLRRRRI